MLKRLLCVYSIMCILAFSATAAEISSAKVGILKLSSAPLKCTVHFRGNRYEKNRAVMTFTNVPVGEYSIVFDSKNGKVQKRAVVRESEVTILFGNMMGSSKKTIEPARTSVAVTTAPIARKAPVATSQEDANDIYRLAEILRRSFNPFTKGKRYREAEKLYRKILRRWPDSDKVEMCHYRLAEIYESIYVKNYNQSIIEFKKVIEYNFDTELDARLRIANLYEKALGDKKLAKEWYELAIQYSRSEKIRRRAGDRVEALKKQGF